MKSRRSPISKALWFFKLGYRTKLNDPHGLYSNSINRGHYLQSQYTDKETVRIMRILEKIHANLNTT